MRMMLLARRRPARLPASSAIREHAERQRRDRQAGLHRVVLEHHLQVDRERDHRAAEGDLLEHLLGDAEPEDLRLEQVRDRAASACPRACAAGASRRASRARSRRPRCSAPTDSPPSCHTRIPSTMPPIPTTDRTAPTRSTCREPVYGTSWTSSMPDRTIAMMTASSEERDAPRQVRRDEAADQRADGGGDRGGGADEWRRPSSAPRPRSCRG